MSDTTAAPAPAAVPKPIDPADTPHDRRVFWLAVGIVLIMAMVLLLLFFRPMPSENKDVLNTVIGVIVGTGFGSVVGFYYGSSVGSKAKDAALSSLAGKP